MMKTKKQQLTVVALLGVMAVGVFLCEPWRAVAADAPAHKGKSSTNDLAINLVGTWKLETAANPGSPSGVGTRLKYFTGTHWCIIQPDPKTGEVIFQHGGRYVLEGHTLKETVDFAGENTKSSIGKTGTRIIEIEGDVYKQIDPNGVFNETWKRVK